MAQVGNVANYIVIDNCFPQLSVGIKQVNPVGRPKFAVSIEDAARITIAGGFGRNTMSVGDRGMPQFPLAPRRLRESQRHIPASWEIASLAVVEDRQVQHPP